MRLNTKVRVDLVASRLVACENIRATDCLVWCSRDHIFSLKTTKYPYRPIVAKALEGYSAAPRFPLLELATHAWFAGRSAEPYAQHLMAIGFDDRQRCKPLGSVEQRFVEHFTKAIEGDLKPVIDIVCGELKNALATHSGEIEEDTRAYDSSQFTKQLRNTFEWTAERHSNFAGSSGIPKGMKSLGEAALVPFVDLIPHADVQVNSVVCVTSNQCDDDAMTRWAKDVGINENHNDLHRPVLVLATRNIKKGQPLFRDCNTNKYVGVTSGKEKMMLPPRLRSSSL